MPRSLANRWVSRHADSLARLPFAALQSKYVVVEWSSLSLRRIADF